MSDPYEQTVKVGQFDVPTRLAALTGCEPTDFEWYGDAQFATIQRFLDIRPHDSVLEIGCGVGRLAIPATRVLAPPGSYFGLDIIADSIRWCAQHITPRFPNFRFHFVNINSPIHNPAGTDDPALTRIPLSDASVDKILLSSVFTHMFPAGVRNYLQEFSRVLKPEGRSLSTMFLLNSQTRAAISSGKTNWTFAHDFDGRGVWFVDSLTAPEGAVAYDETEYIRMIRANGLELLRPVEYGTWAGLGGPAADGQDYVLFGRART